MRILEIGPKDVDVALNVEVRVDPAKVEVYRQVILSAIQEYEKREPKPCHGCGEGRG